jgi:predicted kinase
MNTVVIMRGPSGVGKTTYINKHYPDAFVCSADNFFGPDYEFDPRLLPQAHQKCFSDFLHALWTKQPLVVVDNTAIATWEYENYCTAAQMMGYELEIVEFKIETVAQLRAVCARSAHGVPPEITAKNIIAFEHDPRAIEIPVEV